MKPNTQAYFDLHKKTLLDMKEKAIASVILKRALKKMVYECPCGAVVGCKQLQYHFISKKHRSVMGDIIVPADAPLETKHSESNGSSSSY
jgi:hypothetical protein